MMGTSSFAETKVSNFSLFETKIWDLISMQNVLNNVSDRSSRLSGTCTQKFHMLAFIYVLSVCDGSVSD